MFIFRGIQTQSSTLSTRPEDDQLSQVSTGAGNQTGILIYLDFLLFALGLEAFWWVDHNEFLTPLWGSALFSLRELGPLVGLGQVSMEILNYKTNNY